MTTSAISQRTKVSWEVRLGQITTIISRLGLAYLFFSQLFWKMPADFGCGDSFTFTHLNAEGQLVRTSGLCDWLGIESVYASRDHAFFGTDFNNDGSPELSLNLAALIRLNDLFVENVVMPNIGWFGWLIWLAEAFIAFSLFLGIFSRLGALVAQGVSTQLMLGLAPGRVLGLDALLPRPRLTAAADRGGRPAKLLVAFT